MSISPGSQVRGDCRAHAAVSVACGGRIRAFGSLPCNRWKWMISNKLGTSGPHSLISMQQFSPGLSEDSAGEWETQTKTDLCAYVQKLKLDKSCLPLEQKIVLPGHVIRPRARARPHPPGPRPGSPGSRTAAQPDGRTDGRTAGQPHLSVAASSELRGRLAQAKESTLMFVCPTNYQRFPEFTRPASRPEFHAGELGF